MRTETARDGKHPSPDASVQGALPVVHPTISTPYVPVTVKSFSISGKGQGPSWSTGVRSTGMSRSTPPYYANQYLNSTNQLLEPKTRDTATKTSTARCCWDVAVRGGPGWSGQGCQGTGCPRPPGRCSGGMSGRPPPMGSHILGRTSLWDSSRQEPSLRLRLSEEGLVMPKSPRATCHGAFSTERARLKRRAPQETQGFPLWQCLLYAPQPTMPPALGVEGASHGPRPPPSLNALADPTSLVQNSGWFKHTGKQGGIQNGFLFSSATCTLVLNLPSSSSVPALASGPNLYHPPPTELARAGCVRNTCPRVRPLRTRARGVPRQNILQSPGSSEAAGWECS